ncbi:MAG: ribonuclease III [Thermincola sp.]|jgi:ribonuclease-3|nr:ribonuclease III [Thermincola sp.]MDT3701527.1 ribonuclease III [Thermincola sp.]
MTFNQESVKKIKSQLGIPWNNEEHLLQALTHSSFAHENRNHQVSLDHNQRLEFLGDAVLELVVSDYLYKRYPDFPEGTLTKIRAGIVCEPSLAGVANNMSLGEFLLMGKGEERSGGRRRPSILADAMEALIGAVYVDQGIEQAYGFVIEKLADVIEKVVESGGLKTDYKTQLQELVQKKSENALGYRILEETGPDHSKTFIAGVSCRGTQWGQGSGRTKKEAEQDAARHAMEKILRGEINYLDGEMNG